MRKERNFGLDVLRALAITLVVVSHCTYIFVQESQHLVVLFIRTIGAVGVDLFFVLSGFLIGGLLLKEIDQHRTQFPHLLTFWKRRWWRTLPNYFLMLLVNMGVFFIFSHDLPDNIGAYLLFLQNFSTPHPGFFTEAWSLSIEEYAYLILPFLMFCAFFFFKARGALVFLWTTLTVILIGILIKLNFYLHAEVLSYGDWSSMFRKVVIYRLDAIYIGFLLVYLMRNGPNVLKKLKLALLVMGIGLFASIHLLIYARDLAPETHLYFFVFMYLPLIAISCALAFPFAIHMERNTTFGRLVYFVSTRSYAIYLLNFSAVLTSFHYVMDLGSVSLAVKIGICALYLALTLGLSNALYVYFEKPILNYRDRNLRQ